MEESKHNHNAGSTSEREGEDEPADLISVEQLQRLVRLLDRSDASEIELKRVSEGMHLVLRKARSDGKAGQNEHGSLPVSTDIAKLAVTAQPQESKHKIVSPLVGIFHASAKPKGGTLVALGDRVKAGQLVATVQSLNIINEVESPVTGRVVEILVQDGQPVEYGQQLMTVDSVEGA